MVSEQEDKFYQNHTDSELTDDYKLMIDQMISQEEDNTAKYVSYEDIKNRFLSKS